MGDSNSWRSVRRGSRPEAVAAVEASRVARTTDAYSFSSLACVMAQKWNRSLAESITYEPKGVRYLSMDFLITNLLSLFAVVLHAPRSPSLRFCLGRFSPAPPSLPLMETAS